MPFYLYQGAYTGEAWAKLIAGPKDLSEVMEPTIERFGGKVVACMLSLESEPYGFVEFPDDTAAAAWSMFMLAQRSVKTVRMTQLITSKAGLEAMSKAGAANNPPLEIW